VNFRLFLVLKARFGFWMFGLARFEAGAIATDQT